MNNVTFGAITGGALSGDNTIQGAIPGVMKYWVSQQGGCRGEGGRGEEKGSMYISKIMLLLFSTHASQLITRKLQSELLM